MPAEPTPDRSLHGLSEPPSLGVPDAVRSLLAAVDRAGPRWTFHDRRRVRGVDLDDATQIWPVRLSSGALLGLVVQHPGEPQPEDELIEVLVGALQGLVQAERAMAAVERRALRAERAASADPMTGLANRRAWREALGREGARVARHQSAVVVAVVDLDGLKAVNDEQGHLAGDLLIQRTARVLREAVRETDLVARLGGDEFGVLAVQAPGGDGDDAADQVADRLRSALTSAGIDASVGAASAPAGRPLGLAVDDADRAMYQEKARRTRLRGAAPRPDRGSAPSPPGAAVLRG
ncbi:MAG: GGDEF domain-containing protein [Acidimicrobiia bacterium]